MKASEFYILSMKEILKILGISKSTFYRLLKNDPSFPQPIRLGARRVGYNSESLRHWVESQAPNNPDILEA